MASTLKKNQKTKKLKILVSGGAGYVGSVLVPLLIEAGHEVRVVDDLIYGQKSPVTSLDHPGYEFIQANLLDEEVIKKVVEGVDMIINLAALVGEPICRENSGLSYEINTGLVGKINRNRGDIPLISMSSTSVYGETTGKMCDEDSTPGPYQPYALNKLGAEHIVLESENYIILRPATAFGYSPRPRLDLLPNDFTYKAVSEGYLEIFNPDVMRTFIHVYDLATVIHKMAESFEKNKNQVFNVGSNDMNFSKRQLAETIKKKHDFVLKIVEDYDDPDKRNFTVNYDKLFGAIDYQPRFDLEQGIEDLIDHYKDLKRHSSHINSSSSLALVYTGAK